MQPAIWLYSALYFTLRKTDDRIFHYIVTVLIALRLQTSTNKRQERQHIMDNSESLATPLEAVAMGLEAVSIEAIDFQGNESVEGVDTTDNESIALSEMEDFVGYKPKIEELLSNIGLAGFSIEEIHHGYDYQNCVYTLTSPIISNEQYVLRVPVETRLKEDDYTHEAIKNDACLLAYLADKLPVPRVKAYSITKDNALNAPYTVQTRLPGQSLDTVYDDFSHTEKLAIAEQYVELLAKIESIRFTAAGTFTASDLLPDTVHNCSLTAPPSIHIFDEGAEEFTKDPNSVQDRQGPNVEALLTNHVNGWVQQTHKDDIEAGPENEHGSFILPGYNNLIRIIEELDHEGAFRDGPYPIVLHHWDLEPRNIMVENSSNGWKITGMIDWDDAIAVPRPLGRRPPDWIWDGDYEGFTGYLDNDHYSNPNLSEESKALKAHFDAKAAVILEGYLEDAYGYGRWMRRIWTLARKGADNMWYIDLMKQVGADWAARLKPGNLPIDESVADLSKTL